jgi:ABC-type multidrug transport system ATPase subunit
MTPIVEIRDLHKSFKKFKALSGVNLTINQGEIFGLLGLNGAGKSTTIRCLLTLIKPSSGEILYKGQNIKNCRSTFLRQVGCIVEKPDFYISLTAYTNMKLSSYMYNMSPDKNRIFEILKLVGLEGKEYVKAKTYSQGMKQRLGIALALLHDPEIIILDEPSNGLDPRGMLELRQLIFRLKNEFHKTIIISSHILSEVELLVDSLIIIDHGKNIIQGSAKELLSSDNMLVTIESPEQERLAAVLKESSYAGQIETLEDQSLTIRAPKEQLPDLHRFLVNSGLPIHNFYTRKKLEDLFLKLTER